MIDRDTTVRLLGERGIEPRKVLGQNFVVDDQILERIVQLADLGPGSCVVEIGPGLGALTAQLARTSRRVVAVEKDESLISVIREIIGTARERVDLIAADAVEVNWNELLAPDQDWVLVANLPYNVSVPIIMGVLRSAPMITRGLVMVQREVAERLAATPGGRTIGVPSIELAWHASAVVVGIIPPEVFHPVPNVSSALLEFRRREPPSTKVDVDDVMRLVAAAYRKRRKMLRSSLAHLLTPQIFEAAGIDPTLRPENLGLDDWVNLAEHCAAV